MTHEKVPTWLDQAPTSASREAFHPSGIFHAFSRMRFLHFHDSRHPLISLATTPWQRVDVVTGHLLVISNPRFARHLRPLPCHSSLGIEGMKGQCHVASLTWWNDVMRNVTVKNWKSAAAVTGVPRHVPFGIRSGIWFPRLRHEHDGKVQVSSARYVSYVFQVTNVESSVAKCVAICCNCYFLWGKWLDDVGCEQRWALVPVYVCLTNTFTINLMRLISRPVTDRASLYVLLLVFVLHWKCGKNVQSSCNHLCRKPGERKDKKTHQVPLQSISARATAASRQPWTGCIGDAHCLVNCGPAKKSLFRLLMLRWNCCKLYVAVCCWFSFLKPLTVSQKSNLWSVFLNMWVSHSTFSSTKEEPENQNRMK